MNRIVIAFAVLIFLGACASAPKLRAVATAPHVQFRDPANTPVAVIGESECGEFQGFIVVTADGKITVIPDTDKDDLAGMAKLVPDDSADSVNLGAFCPPKIKT